MLQQVIVNLMRNALEAQREAPGPQARVLLRLQRVPGLAGVPDEQQLDIVDHGCGIPEDGESRLFVPFESSKPDGMGIGLKICRSFVELHQGRLWFTRHAPPDTGCSFHIALRAAPPPPSAPGRCERAEAREPGPAAA
nr:ATP-binding protein [Rubrivivax benzoatilyticus]